MAERGKIQLVCWGRWRFRNTVWVGKVYVQATDLHMVMSPGHPDF
jgi:maltoporin